ncbi:MAG: signal peptide peptidase SppA [Bacteroidota bacterium]
MKKMKTKIKPILKNIFLASIVLTMAMYWYDQGAYYFTNEYDFTYKENWCLETGNVAVINIYGEIATYSPESYYDKEQGQTFPTTVSSEDVVYYINEAENDEYIEAIIVTIDSYGGYPVASEEIMNALKRTTKPTIAVIREGAVSGGYLIASGADKIYASEMSDVGSIGITMSYLDYSQQNKQEGIIYQQLSSGKFKDTGDPDKTLTAEEKELFMRDIKILHEAFVKRVAENRGLDIEEVEKLADGSTMLGRAAKENGLIDEIGDIEDAKNWLRNEFQIEPELCFY